jgi:hypothetical protein
MGVKKGVPFGTPFLSPAESVGISFPTGTVHVSDLTSPYRLVAVTSTSSNPTREQNCLLTTLRKQKQHPVGCVFLMRAVSS